MHEAVFFKGYTNVVVCSCRDCSQRIKTIFDKYVSFKIFHLTISININLHILWLRIEPLILNVNIATG